MRRTVSTALVTLTGALVASPAFAEECALRTGAPVDGIRPVQIDCRWSDVDVDRLHAALADPAAQAGIFAGLTESVVVGRQGRTTRVRQRFSASPASDREVVVDYRVDAIDGGRRYSWHKSVDQSALRGDAVEVDVHEGSWEVREQADGVRVTYELRLALGGMLPGFMTSWAQGGAIRETLAELERFAHHP